MKSVFLLIFSLFLLLQPLYAQVSEEGSENEKVSNTFREDQFYLGVSFVALLSNTSSFDQRGLSSQLQLGWVRDIPLVASSKLALGFGLGHAFHRYTTNLRLQVSEGVSTNYMLDTAEDAPKTIFAARSIDFPISLRWRDATPDSFAFWRIYAGVKLRWNYWAKQKNALSKTSILADLNRWNTEAFLNFGYNTWNFYLAYDLQPLFIPITLLDSPDQLQIRPIRIGLIFYIL